jgi:hypothetical protein
VVSDERFIDPRLQFMILPVMLAMRRPNQNLGATLRRGALLLAGFVLTGCSLLTIKSPEIPLTAREQEARLLTRDYAAHFATTIAHLIDDATHADAGIATRSQALRLKLGAVTEITRASTGGYLGVFAAVS